MLEPLCVNVTNDFSSVIERRTQQPTVSLVPNAGPNSCPCRRHTEVRLEPISHSYVGEASLFPYPIGVERVPIVAVVAV